MERLTKLTFLLSFLICLKLQFIAAGLQLVLCGFQLHDNVNTETLPQNCACEALEVSVFAQPHIDYHRNYKLSVSRGLAAPRRMRAAPGKVINTDQNKCRYVTQPVRLQYVRTLTICMR